MKYGLLFLLSGWLILKGIVPAWNNVYSDFSNYFLSAQLVLEKNTDRLYDNEWFQQQLKIHGMEEPGKFAPFPPLTAWLLLPLAGTDVLSANRIWIVINLVMLVACIFLIRHLIGWKWIDASLIMLAGGNGLVNNFRFGQIYLLISAGLFFILWLEKRNQFWWSGLVLGILSWLKYVPLVLLGGWLSLRQYRIPLTTLVSMTGLLVLQFIFFGPGLMSTFFTGALLPHLDANLEGQNMYSFLFQSWDNLFRHLFVFSATENPEPVLDWAMGRWIGKAAVFSALVATLFLAIRKVLALSIDEGAKQSILLAYFFLAAYVILPASATYHFILLCFPIILMIQSEFFSQQEKSAIIIIYFLIGFIPYTTFFAIAEKAGLLFAYPRLWLMTLLFVICLRPAFRNRVPAIIDSKPVN